MRGLQRKGLCLTAGCLIVLLLALPACATRPELKSPLLPADLEGMGVVVGSLTSQRIVGILGSMNGYGGHELSIEDVHTGDQYTYTGAGYFQWILPPGEYAVTRIGLAGKDLVPGCSPFRFSVEEGAIKSLGAIVTDRDVSEGNFTSRRTYLLVDRKAPAATPPDRAPQKVRPREVTLYVTDARAVVEETFRRRNPALSLQPVVEDHMR